MTAFNVFYDGSHRLMVELISITKKATPMAIPGSSSSFFNQNPDSTPGKKPPKNNFPKGPDLNRGPAPKADRSRTLPGARRVNKPQSR